jgi:hypothetical protein
LSQEVKMTDLRAVEGQVLELEAQAVVVVHGDDEGALGRDRLQPFDSAWLRVRGEHTLTVAEEWPGPTQEKVEAERDEGKARKLVGDRHAEV